MSATSGGTEVMQRRGLTLVEVVVVLAIMGILATILLPVLRRPQSWSQTPMPPLHFKNAELQTVMMKLHRELYQKRKMDFLKSTRWQTPSLKHRKVTFETTQELPLKQVLSIVEKQGHVVFQGFGSCGTCGWPMGDLRVLSTPNSKRAKPSNVRQVAPLMSR